jgi:hypothetical protein
MQRILESRPAVGDQHREGGRVNEGVRLAGIAPPFPFEHVCHLGMGPVSGIRQKARTRIPLYPCQRPDVPETISIRSEEG